MRSIRWPLVPLLAGVMTGCASLSPIALSPQGSQVLPLAADPGPGCMNLGNVVAESRAYALSERVESAMNEVKNQAARRGATHVLLSAPVTDRSSSSGVVVTAIAYQCPPGTLSAAPVGAHPSSVTPGPVSAVSPEAAPPRPLPASAAPPPAAIKGPRTF